MRAGQTDIPNVESGTAPGDLVATEGRWADAIASWERALLVRPDLNRAVGDRLVWFLQHSPSPGRQSFGRSIRLIITSGIAALIAAALVLLSTDPGTISSSLTAAAAWLMIAVSAGTAILATRRIGLDRTATDTDLRQRFADARIRADRLAHPKKKEQMPS